MTPGGGVLPGGGRGAPSPRGGHAEGLAGWVRGVVAWRCVVRWGRVPWRCAGCGAGGRRGGACGPGVVGGGAAGGGCRGGVPGAVPGAGVARVLRARGRRLVLVQQAGLGDQVGELGAAAAAEQLGRLADMGGDGPGAHAEAPGDRLVRVAVDHELEDRAAGLVGEQGRAVRAGGVVEGDGALPGVVEDADEVADEAGVFDGQGELAALLGGVRDEGDPAVADDEPVEDLVQGAHLGARCGDLLHVGQRGAVGADGVLVDGALAYAAAERGHVGRQRLLQQLLSPAAARLRRQQLIVAGVHHPLQRGVDGGSAPDDPHAGVAPDGSVDLLHLVHRHSCPGQDPLRGLDPLLHGDEQGVRREARWDGDELAVAAALYEAQSE